MWSIQSNLFQHVFLVIGFWIQTNYISLKYMQSKKKKKKIIDYGLSTLSGPPTSPTCETHN